MSFLPGGGPPDPPFGRTGRADRQAGIPFVCLFLLGLLDFLAALRALGQGPSIYPLNLTASALKISSGILPFQFLVTLHGFQILDNLRFPMLDDNGFPILNSHGFPKLDNHGFPILDTHSFPILDNHWFLILLANHGFLSLLDNHWFLVLWDNHGFIILTDYNNFNYSILQLQQELSNESTM